MKVFFILCNFSRTFIFHFLQFFKRNDTIYIKTQYIYFFTIFVLILKIQLCYKHSKHILVTIHFVHYNKPSLKAFYQTKIQWS